MKTSKFYTVTMCLIMGGGQFWGCTTSITHQKIKSVDELKKPGYSYFLPQQKFIAFITYELMRCPNDPNLSNSANMDFEIYQTATLLEETEADIDEHYLLTYESLNAVLKTSKFEAEIYPNQTIKSVGITIEDKTAAVIKNVTGTAISVAKMIMGIPPGRLTPEQRPCNEKTYQALKTVREGQIKVMDPNVDSERRAAVGETITNTKQHLRIVLRKELRPTWNKLNEAFKIEDEQLEKWFVSGFRNYLVNQNLNKFEASISTQIAVIPKLEKSTDPKNIDGKGVLYRDPLPAKVLVCAPDCKVNTKKVSANLNTQVAQLGRKMAITLENGWFDSNNVSLSFAANGALESMEAGKESSLEKFSGALADTSTQVQSFLEAKQEKKKAEEEAMRNFTLNAIKAETDLLKAKYEKIEAENRLRSIGGDPSQ